MCSPAHTCTCTYVSWAWLLIYNCLDYKTLWMISMVYSSNILQNVPLARELLYRSVVPWKILLPTGEFSGLTVRTACRHISPCHSFSLTSFKKPMGREQDKRWFTLKNCILTYTRAAAWQVPDSGIWDGTRRSESFVWSVDRSLGATSPTPHSSWLRFF